MTRDSIRGSSDRSILILTSLADGPKHGYALIKDIEDFAGTKLGAGTLYGALAKLERAGLVEALPAAAPAPVPDHPGGPGGTAGPPAAGVPHRRGRAAADLGGPVMSRRLARCELVRRLVALYPRAWRERYGGEVGDLTDELIREGRDYPAAGRARAGRRGGHRARPGA